METEKRSVEKIASVSAGKMVLNPVATRAAIDGYKRAIRFYRNPTDKIYETVRLGDFCYRARYGMEALKAYREAITLCFENESKRSPRFKEVARYCANRISIVYRDILGGTDTFDIEQKRVEEFYSSQFYNK